MPAHRGNTQERWEVERRGSVRWTARAWRHADDDGNEDERGYGKGDTVRTREAATATWKARCPFSSRLYLRYSTTAQSKAAALVSAHVWPSSRCEAGPGILLR